MSSHHKKLQSSISSLTPQTLVVIIIAGILGVLAFTLFQKNASLSNENRALTTEKSIFSTSDRVFEYSDKTYVAYDGAPTAMTVYSATSCATCADEITKIERKIRTAVPTLSDVTILDTDEPEHKEAALKKGIAYLPGITFSQSITGTDFYAEGAAFFDGKSDDTYQFYAHSLGHAPQAFIASPKNMKGLSQENRAELATEPSGEIHAFLTTDCASCKTAHDTLGIIQKNNPTVKIVRHYSENLQEKEHLAARAIACAATAGKEDAYSNTLYARQAAWKAVAELEPVLLNYATALGIEGAVFTSCLSADNQAIVEQERLFATFGVSEVPTIFVGDTRFVGVQKIQTLQTAITSTAPTPQTQTAQ